MNIRARTAVSALIIVTMIGVAASGVGAATTGESAKNKAIATAGLLVASDLPATYVEAARDTSSDASTTKTASKLGSCKKLVAFMTAVKKNPEVKSDDFNQGQTTIDNTVTVFPSAAQAKTAVDAYAATGLPACFSQLVTKLVDKKGVHVKASIKQVKDVTAGDQAIAYEGPIAIQAADGSAANLAFGQLVIRIGPAVVVYSYNHDAQTDISSDLKNAVDTSGSRLQSALEN